MEAVYKKVSRAGGLTIPSAVRREMGIKPGDAMEIKKNTDGELVIGRYNLRCTFCETTENVHNLSGKGICSECAAKAYEQMKGNE